MLVHCYKCLRNDIRSEDVDQAHHKGDDSQLQYGNQRFQEHLDRLEFELFLFVLECLYATLQLLNVLFVLCKVVLSLGNELSLYQFSQFAELISGWVQTATFGLTWLLGEIDERHLEAV